MNRTVREIESTRLCLLERLNRAEGQAQKSGLPCSVKALVRRSAMVEKELAEMGRRLVHLYVEAFGRRANTPSRRQNIQEALGKLEKEFKERLFRRGIGRLMTDESIEARFDRETLRVRVYTLQELEHEMKKRPSFFRRRKDELLVGILSGALGVLIKKLLQAVIVSK